jgi:hypothetical protein
MTDIGIVDKWINIMLRTIRDQGLGPTYTSRFLYLVSTIIYYSFICFYNVSQNCLVEDELQIIYLEVKDVSYLDCIIFTTMSYLYDLLGYNKNILVQTSNSINNQTAVVIDNLKLFLNRRDNDGWKNANVQPAFPNGDAFIDTESAQDLNALLQNKHSWTPLKQNGGVQKYLTPEWGKVSPLKYLNMEKYAKIIDENLANHDRNIEIAEILSVYEKMNDSQRMIAEYFQGGQTAPPGMWNIWGLYTVHATQMPALNAVKFFYLLNSTLFTASIAAWGAKRKYMQSRPIQEIRLLPDQQVTNFDGTKASNKLWKTFQQQYNQTPPFPDMVSGHSTFSSSAAVIFDKFFPKNFNEINFKKFSNEHGTMISSLLSNNDYPNTVKTLMVKTHGSSVVHSTTNLRFPTSAVKMEFSSWRQLAELSGISRIYGGIHGNNSNMAGLIMGETIAHDILERAGL